MFRRIAIFVALLIAAWVVMTFTHETGHIVGGWIGGATLQEFDVAPWRLPYSFHAPDPRPRLTLWAGPLLGVMVPAMIALAVGHLWFRFIADFCLLANGAYLALAWISGDRWLDTPRLFEAGGSPIAVGMYCVLTIGFGYVRFRRDCVALLSPADPERVIAINRG